MNKDTEEDANVDDFDFAAALAAPTARAGNTLKGRRAAERKKLSESDRKKINVTGRTEQLNLRVRPMDKVEFLQAAAIRDILPTVLWERAWQHYKRTTLNQKGAP